MLNEHVVVERVMKKTLENLRKTLKLARNEHGLAKPLLDIYPTSDMLRFNLATRHPDVASLRVPPAPQLPGTVLLLYFTKAYLLRF